MYKVIAKLIAQKESRVKCFWIAKTYKTIKMAEKFVASQSNHSTHYFEIEAAA